MFRILLVLISLCLSKCTVINDLPSEVMFRIMRESETNTLCLMLTCRQWRGIITDYIEQLTIDSLADEEDTEWLSSNFDWRVDFDNSCEKLLNVSAGAYITVNERNADDLPLDILSPIFSRLRRTINYKNEYLINSADFLDSLTVYLGVSFWMKCPVESYFVPFIAAAGYICKYLKIHNRRVPVLVVSFSKDHCFKTIPDKASVRRELTYPKNRRNRLYMLRVWCSKFLLLHSLGIQVAFSDRWLPIVHASPSLLFPVMVLMIYASYKKYITVDVENKYAMPILSICSLLVDIYPSYGRLNIGSWWLYVFLFIVMIFHLDWLHRV